MGTKYVAFWNNWRGKEIEIYVDSDGTWWGKDPDTKEDIDDHLMTAKEIDEIAEAVWEYRHQEPDV